MKNAGENAMRDHRKRTRDPSQFAKLMSDFASGEVEDREPGDERPRGRAGGLKGGAARANVLAFRICRRQAMAV